MTKGRDGVESRLPYPIPVLSKIFCHSRKVALTLIWYNLCQSLEKYNYILKKAIYIGQVKEEKDWFHPHLPIPSLPFKYGIQITSQFQYEKSTHESNIFFPFQHNCSLLKPVNFLITSTRPLQKLPNPRKNNGMKTP